MLTLADKEVCVQDWAFARVFCGADDFEMRAIEAFCHKYGIAHEDALKKGKRVTPSSAYDMDVPDLRWGVQPIFIECSPSPEDHLVLHPVWNAISLDHHRLGDYGYGMDCTEFSRASALGQLIELANRSGHFGCIKPTKRQLLIMASDHCPFDAESDNCLGVSKWEAMVFGIQETVKTTGLNFHEVKALIGYYRQVLKSITHYVHIGKDEVAVVGGVFDPGYTKEFLCLLAASREMRIPILLCMRSELAKLKWHLANVLHLASIDWFMNYVRENYTVKDLYGNSCRRYAGFHADQIPVFQNV
jgi:hypothetical protein